MTIRIVVSAFAATAGLALVSGCSITEPTYFGHGSIAGPQTPPTPTTTVSPHRGFIWSAETGLQVIPLPSNATSMDVISMNSQGQVVGWVTVGEGTENYRAFLWSAIDGYKAIGSLVGPDGISMAWRVDDAGEVKGLSDGPSSDLLGGPMGIILRDAFVWTASSGMRSIGLADAGLGPPNPPAKLELPTGSDCSRVVDVNNNGQVLGYAGFLTIIDGCYSTSAVMWDADGKAHEIGDCGPQPWCGITLRDMNNLGEVVGYREDGGFRWTNAAGFVQIPMKNASVSVINDDGDAAGSVGVGGVSTPIVWTASGTIKTIQLPAGATYGFSVSINRNGQVAGTF